MEKGYVISYNNKENSGYIVSERLSESLSKFKKIKFYSSNEIEPYSEVEYNIKIRNNNKTAMIQKVIDTEISKNFKYLTQNVYYGKIISVDENQNGLLNRTFITPYKRELKFTKENIMYNGIIKQDDTVSYVIKVINKRRQAVIIDRVSLKELKALRSVNKIQYSEYIYQFKNINKKHANLKYI